MTAARGQKQQRRDELAARPVEDEQRVEHVLIVEAVEERQLLVAVRRVIGAIGIDDDQLAVGIELCDVVPLELAPQRLEFAPCDRVLEPRQRGLRRQRVLTAARQP